MPDPIVASRHRARGQPRLVPLLAALLVTALLAAAPSPLVAQAPPSLRSRIDSLVEAPIRAGQVAGATVAVVRGTDTIALRGDGRANVELDVPMGVDAIHEIGSVTKQFTGVAILQLVGEGKHSLDDDLQQQLPSFDTQGRRVTIRRLLDHTSGIRGYTEMQEFGPLAPFPLSRDTLLRLVERRPFDFEAGKVARFAGRYTGSGRGGTPVTVTVAVEDGRLIATQGARRLPLVHLGDGVFEREGTRVLFRETAGRVTALRLDGGGGNVLLPRADP
jgi:CubicO group peptidase (beta-lactamase class C family)